MLVFYWVISWFCFDKLSTLNSLHLSLCLQTSPIFWKACFFEHEQENHMHCRSIYRESSEHSYGFLRLPGWVKSFWKKHHAENVTVFAWTFAYFQTPLLSRLRWDCICYLRTCDFRLFKVTSQNTNPYVTVLSSLLCSFPLVRGVELFVFQLISIKILLLVTQH